MAETMEKTMDAIRETRTHAAKVRTQDGRSGPLREKVQAVVEAASTLTDRAVHTAEEWTSCAGDIATEAKDHTQDFAAAVAAKAVGLSKELRGLVRRYPVPALLVGVGVGLLVLQAVRRCRSN
jgi:hypothetical protein